MDKYRKRVGELGKGKFWHGFDKCVHELAPKNKKLLEKREKFYKNLN